MQGMILAMFDHRLPIVILLPISTQVHKYTVCKPFTIYHLQHGIYYPSPPINLSRSKVIDCTGRFFISILWPQIASIPIFNLSEFQAALMMFKGRG